MGNRPNALLPVIREAQTPLDQSEKNLKNQIAIDPHESSPSSSSVSSDESPKIVKKGDTEKAETKKPDDKSETEDRDKLKQ